MSRNYTPRTKKFLKATVIVSCLIILVYTPPTLFTVEKKPEPQYMKFEKELCKSQAEYMDGNHSTIWKDFNKETQYMYWNQLKSWNQLKIFKKFKFEVSNRPAECPKGKVVTTKMGKSFGDLLTEYACVLAVGNDWDKKPYVPGCIRDRLDEIFEGLSIPSLNQISHCNLDETKFVSFDGNDDNNENLLLPDKPVWPKLVFRNFEEIKKEFTFKKELLEMSQDVIRSTNSSNSIYVGVHALVGDHFEHLKKKHHPSLYDWDFFLKGMSYFEKKYGNVTFLLMAQSEIWRVERFLHKSNVHVVKVHSESLNLAILASCNHTIIDYGAVGILGAALAGGETVYCYFDKEYETSQVAEILPNWIKM